MKDRPILFSGPMIRALLAGTKTQTRRIAHIRDLNILRHPGDMVTWSVSFLKAVRGVLSSHSGGKFSELQARSIIASQFNPYGQPGDRLWVRETWAPLTIGYAYAADPVWNESPAGRWHPSIHMPRRASRITLEITAVRVERLQDISEADSMAEGVEKVRELVNPECTLWRSYGDDGTVACRTAKCSYRTLWEKINGPGSWDANPWVWVVEFRRAMV